MIQSCLALVHENSWTQLSELSQLLPELVVPRLLLIWFTGATKMYQDPYDSRRLVIFTDSAESFVHQLGTSSRGCLSKNKRHDTTWRMTYVLILACVLAQELTQIARNLLGRCFPYKTNEPRKKKKNSYFPLNSGCLIGILIIVYYNPHIIG